MKMLKILLAFFLVSFITSCQKEFTLTDPTNPTTIGTDSVSSKIKTYTEDVTQPGMHSVTTYDVAYDNNNRIISLISESNPGNKFVYGYSPIYTFDIYDSGSISIHNQFFLNSNSFVDSAFQYNNTNDTTTNKYFYNSSNQLLKDITYSIENGVQTIDNITQYTYDSNGNNITETDDDGTYTYDYYTDKINNIVLIELYPIGNKNVVKTTTYNDGSGTVTVFNHTYTFDAHNRVTSETQSDGNGDISIKSYTYY